MSDEEHVEVDVELVYQTDLALLCRVPATPGWRDVWIPKSVVHDPDGGMSAIEDLVPTIRARLAGEYPSVTLTIPEGFAGQEELV